MKGVYLTRFGAASRSAVADRGISTTRLGYIHGVISHGNDSSNYSPHFTDAAEGTTYREQANDVT